MGCAAWNRVCGRKDCGMDQLREFLQERYEGKARDKGAALFVIVLIALVVTTDSEYIAPIAVYGIIAVQIGLGLRTRRRITSLDSGFRISYGISVALFAICAGIAFAEVVLMILPFEAEAKISNIVSDAESALVIVAVVLAFLRMLIYQTSMTKVTEQHAPEASAKWRTYRNHCIIGIAVLVIVLVASSLLLHFKFQGTLNNHKSDFEQVNNVGALFYMIIVIFLETYIWVLISAAMSAGGALIFNLVMGKKERAAAAATLEELGAATDDQDDKVQN